MSQPTDTFPPYSFSSNHYYSAQSSQQTRNAPLSHWPPPGSRAANAAPSPSPSDPTSRTSSHPRMVPSMGYGQTSARRAVAGIDPHLPNAPFLTVPQIPQVPQVPHLSPVSRSPSAFDHFGDVNPIARFANQEGSLEPWNPVSSMRHSNITYARASYAQPNMDYHTYREGPGSAVESLGTNPDSGYHTFPPPPSAVSTDVERPSQELPAEVTYDVAKLTVDPPSTGQASFSRVANSDRTDQTSQYSGRSTTRSTSKGQEFPCRHCSEVSKTKSEYKKHLLRHDKPFKCDIPNCRRKGKGFGTVNDLVRHRKSVHRIGATENSYQCASVNCRNREKIWPRLDNFKQHIHRMHEDEDEQDLIQRSAYQEPLDASSAAEPLSVAPMDTTLAGIGTERQYSSNEFDDPVSGMSLTPDQEPSHQWSSYDQASTRDFALDVDQSSDVRRKVIEQPLGESVSPDKQRPRNRDPHPPLQRLDALADVASHASAEKGPELRPPQLSNAPQTKADQQQHALQKFFTLLFKEAQGSSSTEPEVSELAITRAISSIVSSRPSTGSSSTKSSSHSDNTATEDATLDKLTRREALKASQAISQLIKNVPRVRTHRTNSVTSNMRKCEHCPVTVARPCDMRKHMKRHTRPYGCTYPSCHKRFGAKSDWKRHENSQHFQRESFRCALPSVPSPQSPCSELFFRPELFKQHLTSHHKVVNEAQLQHEVKARRIGKNGQGQFWCGFCKEIKKLDKKRAAAWDERFDHIDLHFSKKKESIDDWLCMEAKKTKGEVLRDQNNKSSFDDEEEDEDAEGDSSDDDTVAAKHDSQDLTSARPTTRVPEVMVVGTKPHPSHVAISDLHRKRQADADPPPPSSQHRKRKRSQREVVRYCCFCGGGPWGSRVFVTCLHCEHQLCMHCPKVPVTGLDGGAM